MTKKKSLLAFMLAICFMIPAMFMSTACGSNKNPVVGDWETYQIVCPSEKEGEEATIVNLGDKFVLLDITLAKDSYQLTLDDDNISLTLKLSDTNTATGTGTYTEKDGVYTADVVMHIGEIEETFKTVTTHDKENDKLSCKVVYYEDDTQTLYYTLILTRVNGK